VQGVRNNMTVEATLSERRTATFVA
jgi:hypothetical protein